MNGNCATPKVVSQGVLRRREQFAPPPAYRYIIR